MSPNAWLKPLPWYTASTTVIDSQRIDVVHPEIETTQMSYLSFSRSDLLIGPDADRVS